VRLNRPGHSLLDRAIEIGIVGAKAPSEPVPAALGNPLAVNDKDKNTVILYESLMKPGVFTG
jgi:hypothetical protein